MHVLELFLALSVAIATFLSVVVLVVLTMLLFTPTTCFLMFIVSQLPSTTISLLMCMPRISGVTTTVIVTLMMSTCTEAPHPSLTNPLVDLNNPQFAPILLQHCNRHRQPLPTTLPDKLLKFSFLATKPILSVLIIAERKAFKAPPTVEP